MLELPSIVRRDVMCPECGHYQMESVQDKTTSVCRHCSWPVDVYRDGTIVHSPLCLARGRVAGDRLGLGMGNGPIRTVFGFD